MTDDSQDRPPQSQGGGYNDEKQPCDPPPPPPPPPPPQPCPDPCGEKEEMLGGPPKILEQCCPDPNKCCEDKRCCTWEEVDDPCVKAASAGAELDATKNPWIKVECKCEPSQGDCNCKDWGCGCFPQPTCVPCNPCQGLVPDPTNPTGCPGEDCTSDNLRKQLELLNQEITSQQSKKSNLEAEMKANTERAQALQDLIKSFDDIIKKYKEQRYKLLCKEDCLKGFYRDVSAFFKSKYPADYAKELKTTINTELHSDELAKCCKKKLEGSLNKVTELNWLVQEAENEMKNADKAFAIVKDLPKWIEDKFKELETIRDEIDKALNDPDPEKQKWAFYLFYWKFIPKLCKCFPFPFCCEEPKKPDQESTSQTSQKLNQTKEKPTENKEEQPPRPPHLGCKPGDWHPSAITDDLLRQLICCAWDNARDKKQKHQIATDNLTAANNNLELMKKKVEADGKSLDDRIKSRISKVNKPAPQSGSTAPTTTPAKST